MEEDRTYVHVYNNLYLLECVVEELKKRKMAYVIRLKIHILLMYTVQTESHRVHNCGTYFCTLLYDKTLHHATFRMSRGLK